MTYDEALEKIASREKFGIRPGLERIRCLLAKMGNPQDQLKFIHVAGTNAKGSTCAMLSSILREAGFKTGLFISPFITDFCERIQVNNEKIPRETLSRLVAEVFPIIEEMEMQGEYITEFEFVTALGFRYFLEQKCDVVVLEVGLGGRLDATNVITAPILSVLTKIDLDHTSILGERLEEIATEKCGIIKPRGTTIIYPQQHPAALKTIKRIAAARENRCFTASTQDIRVVSETLDGTEFFYNGEKFYLPLLGEHQVKNAVTALCAIKKLPESGFHISREAVRRGLANCHFPARLEVFSREPIILLDGAHNPGGALALKNAIKKYHLPRPLVGIFGMLKDKEVDEFLACLSGEFSDIITLTPKNPRALLAADLAEKALKYCENAVAIDNSSEAISSALKIAGKHGAIVIAGSLYLAAEIRQTLKNHKI